MMEVLWKALRGLMMGLAGLAGSRMVWVMVEGNRPLDVLVWGYLAVMVWAIGVSWERDYEEYSPPGME